MKKIVLNTGIPQVVSIGGPRKFIHIQNLGNLDAYICYDGGHIGPSTGARTLSVTCVAPGNATVLDLGWTNIQNGSYIGDTTDGGDGGDPPEEGVDYTVDLVNGTVTITSAFWSQGPESKPDLTFVFRFDVVKASTIKQGSLSDFGPFAQGLVGQGRKIIPGEIVELVNGHLQPFVLPVVMVEKDGGTGTDLAEIRIIGD